MNYILLSALISFSLLGKPQICEYFVDAKDFEVSWKAFKTPKKVGVGAKFDQVHLNSIRSRSIEEVLYATSFLIDTSTTNTKNKARDAKIVKFFFNELTNGKMIKGMVKSVDREKKQLVATFLINGQSKDVTLDYKLDDKNNFEATGKVDILDFEGSKALSSINKACYKLHEGKTWSDVEIAIKGKISAKC